MDKHYLVKVWTATDADAVLPAAEAFDYARRLRADGHTVSTELWRLNARVLGGEGLRHTMINAGLKQD